MMFRKLEACSETSLAHLEPRIKNKAVVNENPQDLLLWVGKWPLFVHVHFRWHMACNVFVYDTSREKVLSFLFRLNSSGRKS